MQALTAPASGRTSPSLTPLSPFAPSRSGDTTPMTDAPPTRGNFLPLTAAGRSPRGSTFILPTSASAPTAESTAMTNADRVTLAYQLVHFHDVERGDGRTQIAVHFRAAQREHMPDDGSQAVAVTRSLPIASTTTSRPRGMSAASIRSAIAASGEGVKDERNINVIIPAAPDA